MPAIPMSALRRALAEMAAGAGRGVSDAWGGGHIGRGYAGGTLLGSVGGGVAGGVADAPDGQTYVGPGVIGGMLGGMALGAAGGGVVKLARMAQRGVGEGAHGFRYGLRQALAERMASRGIGLADDAARFEEGFAGRRDVPLIEEMREAGARPFSRAPSAYDEMAELAAANKILRRLQNERRNATDPEEIADLDEQIAELTRLLGGQ